MEQTRNLEFFLTMENLTSSVRLQKVTYDSKVFIKNALVVFSVVSARERALRGALAMLSWILNQ